MLLIERTNQFKRDLKLAKRRGKHLEKLKKVIHTLANEEPLNSKFKDHPLKGNWNSRRELHIEPDWLLIYRIISEEKTLILERTGTHSDLFQ